METYLAHELVSAGLYAQYDAHAKKLLKDKGVLAYILKYAVREFADYSLDEAKAAIEGEPEVATHPVRPTDHRNEPEAIRGDSTENNIPGEGTVTFDILFHAYTREGERKKIYVNLEAQGNFYPGYDLVPRGIIYGARLLSEQMDVEYTSTSYDDVKKVYSIWICMNTPQRREDGRRIADTITEYSIQPKTLYCCDDADRDHVARGRYDLISVLFICLKKSTFESANKLIGMLLTLLSDTLSVPRKKLVLENEYGLPMTREMEKEAYLMCNLSAGIAADKDIVIKEKEMMIEQQRAELEQARAEIAALKAQLQEKGN